MTKLKEIGAWALAIGCPPLFWWLSCREFKRLGICPHCGAKLHC